MAQAASLSESTDRSQPNHWFQLAKMRLSALFSVLGWQRPTPLLFLLRFDKRRRRLLLSKRKRSMVDADRMNLPQGSLDLLVLKTLALEPLHGWAVSERLGQMSGRAVQVRQGSLYPALHRLERRGWIRARWGTSENNRRAKYYELTRAGRKRLDTESEAWKRLTTVVSQVLDTP